MTLPPAFMNAEDYFEECVLFLQEYQHLYNLANTDILVNGILDKIDVGCLKKSDIFDKDFELPSSSQYTDFFGKLEKLKAFHNEFIEVNGLEDKVNVPVSPKKRHEIVYLAKEIDEICKESCCDTVVDFGSGLGYLDQQIFETTHLKVLGLECSESNYIAAKKRQRKYHINSVENVKYIKHLITDKSHRNIDDFLRDKFKNHNGFCITGLHACADLTIDAINLFLKMADAKSMVLMPCCYHKMKIDDTEMKFKNFPLSSSLKRMFDKYKCWDYLKVPFLRLAAQPPCRTEDNLEDSAFNLLARAVLQVYAHKNNCILKRNKRKAVKMKTVKNEFSNYVKDAVNGYTLISQINDEDESVNKITSFNIEELQMIWCELSQNSTTEKAAIFILLQNYLQPVIENFVLYDRLMYLKENGVENCTFKRIFNEKTSPRSLALLALK